MSNLIYDIFIRILNMSIMSSIIICAVLIIRLLLKKAPKIFCYLLWSIVLFRLLCPVAISSSFSALRLWKTPATETGSITFFSDSAKKESSMPKTDNVSISEKPVSANAIPTERTAAKDDSFDTDGNIRQKNPAIFYGSILWLAGIIAMTGYGTISAFLLKRRLIGSV